MPYEDERSTKPRSDFWAQLSREDGTSHGATLNSPVFDTETDLMAWVRSARRDGDDIATYERDLRTGKDHRLDATDEDDRPADPERLAKLLADLHETLTLKASELNMPRRPKNTQSDWQKHRANLEAAGRAWRASQNGAEGS